MPLVHDITYSSSRRYHDYLCYRRLLNGWTWEWYVTLTFPPKYDRQSSDRINAELKKWLRKLCTTEHIQVAGWYVTSYWYGHPHIHLLALGTGYRNGRSINLKDIDETKWENEWNHIVNGRMARRFREAAKIEIPRSNSAVARYVASQFLWSKSTWAEINYYNIKLLRKYRDFS